MIELIFLVYILVLGILDYLLYKKRLVEKGVARYMSMEIYSIGILEERATN